MKERNTSINMFCTKAATIIIIAFTAVTTLLTGCDKIKLTISESSSEADNNSEVKIEKVAVVRDPEFASAVVMIKPEDFADLGFEFGDSVDISFDNGVCMNDIPYYNGYYTKIGDPLVCLYPGYKNPVIAYSGGPSLYDTTNLGENSTVSISVHEKGKYLEIQDTFSMVYSNEREDYSSDAQCANFRAMKGGNLKNDFLYRSASPCDNQYGRAPYSCSLMEDSEIRHVLDLADTEEKTASYYEDDAYDISYWRDVYEKDGIYELAMNASFFSADFKAHVADAVRYVINEDGPFLIHCTEGKDRTGFVCFVIGTLADFSLEELENDYMLTYENYYNVSKAADEASYEAVKEVKFNDFVENICGVESAKEVTKDQLYDGVVEYLISASLTQEEIDRFKEKITN